VSFLCSAASRRRAAPEGSGLDTGSAQDTIGNYRRREQKERGGSREMEKPRAWDEGRNDAVTQAQVGDRATDTILEESG